MFVVLSVSSRCAKQEEERRRWRIVGIFKVYLPLLIILLDQSLNHLGKVWNVL